MATKKSNTARFQKSRDQIMGSMKTAHCKVLDIAEELIDGTVATGTKYQRIAASAIKKSEPIIEKQVDIVFDSVEMFVDHIQTNSTRFQKLLGINKQVNKASKQIGKIVKSVSAKVESEFEDKAEAIKNTIKQGQRKADKTIKNVKAESKKTVKATTRKAKTTASSTAKKTRSTARKATSKAKTAVKSTAKRATSAKRKTTAKRRAVSSK